jgi:hypothetical protein
LDTIELDFYQVLKEVYLRHVNRDEIAVKISSDYEAQPLIKTFLRDVLSNKLSQGRLPVLAVPSY